MNGAHREIPDSTDAQRFHEEWNSVNSCPDGGNIPRSVNPYTSYYTLAEYRTQAVESLLPSSLAECSCWEQEINQFYDCRDGYG